MTKLLGHLTNKQLHEILDCSLFKDFKFHFSPDFVKDIFEREKKSNQLFYDNHPISQSISDAFTDAPSYPIILLWTIVGLINLSIIPLSILTFGFMSLFLIMASIFFVSLLKERRKNIKDKTNEFIFSVIKLHCINEIIYRQSTLSKKEAIHHYLNAGLEKIEKDSNQPISSNTLNFIKQTTGVTTLVTATFVGTYYLGISATAIAFGISASLLSGPIGLGVVFGISLLLGLYFGYKHYQALKNNHLFDKTKDKIDREIARKIALSCVVEKKLNKKPVHHSDVSPTIVHQSRVIQPEAKHASQLYSHGRLFRYPVINHTVMFHHKNVYHHRRLSH